MAFLRHSVTRFTVNTRAKCGTRNKTPNIIIAFTLTHRGIDNDKNRNLLLED